MRTIVLSPKSLLNYTSKYQGLSHRLRIPDEEITFTARPKIHSHSQIFKYGQSIFCLPHQPKFSDFFHLCLHWVSVVRVLIVKELRSMYAIFCYLRGHLTPWEEIEITFQRLDDRFSTMVQLKVFSGRV
jgi:hypothetical protein